jgi:dehydrogenase/reductase SDR family member 7B
VQSILNKKLKDKIVVITGASSGIGKSLSLAFAKEGAKLILTARNKQALEYVKLQCEKYCKEIYIYCLDVTDQKSIEQFFVEFSKSFSKIDILVNNAGISQRSLIMETSMEVERKIMETNFWGSVSITKLLMPLLLKSKKSNIAVLSSLAGVFGTPYRGAYSASKHALKGYFETLGLENEVNNLTVLIVYPGFIDTQISHNALEGDGKPHMKMSETQKQGMSADDCAEKIINAIKSNKKEIVIGGKETLMVFFKKYIPSLFYYFIKRQKNLK